MVLLIRCFLPEGLTSGLMMRRRVLVDPDYVKGFVQFAFVRSFSADKLLLLQPRMRPAQLMGGARKHVSFGNKSC